MSLYELLDLLASNYQKIDTLWEFFISIHLAVLGALFLMPRRVSMPERLVAFLAYAAFSYVNRSALVDTYDYHAVLLKEIARFKAAPPDTGGLLVQQIAGFNLQAKTQFLAWSHYLAAAFVAFAMLFANTLAREPETSVSASRDG
jgi:hypothetical protein